MTSPIVVVDTSSLFGHSNRAAIVRACNNGKLIAVWSPHIVAELIRALTIKWIDGHGISSRSLREMSRASKAMMDVLTSVFELVDTGPTEEESPIDLKDRDDHHLVRAARLATASYIVSENVRDFPKADATGRRSIETIEFVTTSGILSFIASPQ